MSVSLPTCPFCGRTGEATEVNRTEGRFYCSCGSLYNGTDREWRRYAKHRREAAERRARTQGALFESGPDG